MEMRTVFAHLKNASDREVAEWLSSFVGLRCSDDMWRYPHAEAPVLYIEFYRDYHSEYEPEEYERLVKELGGEPSTTVVADVSGRADGTTEVKALFGGLLRRFDGLASDNYSSHYWTIERDREQCSCRWLDVLRLYGLLPTGPRL